MPSRSRPEVEEFNAEKAVEVAVEGDKPAAARDGKGRKIGIGPGTPAYVQRPNPATKPLVQTGRLVEEPYAR